MLHNVLYISSSIAPLKLKHKVYGVPENYNLFRFAMITGPIKIHKKFPDQPNALVSNNGILNQVSSARIDHLSIH